MYLGGGGGGVLQRRYGGLMLNELDSGPNGWSRAGDIVLCFCSLRTGSRRGRKKIRRKRDSVSEASGSRSVNPRAKRVRDCSRLVPLTLDYTRLARSKTNREPVRRLDIIDRICVS